MLLSPSRRRVASGHTHRGGKGLSLIVVGVCVCCIRGVWGCSEVREGPRIDCACTHCNRVSCRASKNSEVESGTASFRLLLQVVRKLLSVLYHGNIFFENFD